MCEKTDQETWRAIIEIERKYLREILLLWREIHAKPDVMRQALTSVVDRGTALRFLLLLQSDDLKKEMFPTLVNLASWGHSNIYLCRSLIKSLPRQWVLQRIEADVDEILRASPNDDEFFQRFAELYGELDESLLEKILMRIRSHESAEIREVADYFDSFSGSADSASKSCESDNG